MALGRPRYRGNDRHNDNAAEYENFMRTSTLIFAWLSLFWKMQLPR